MLLLVLLWANAFCSVFAFVKQHYYLLPLNY